jgi:orotate phosphoribosyltransferase
MSSDAGHEILGLLPARTGHFLLESGHHGHLWLELELLCYRPEPIRRLAAGLAERLSGYGVEAVCGPLVEGAFVGLMVAEALAVPCAYSERIADRTTAGLFPVRYAVPRGLRTKLSGRRVAIVNDLINAGSAVRGTLIDLNECGAIPVVIGSLAVLGEAAAQLAASAALALETLARIPNDIWTPADCPLCARGLPLVDLSG